MSQQSVPKRKFYRPEFDALRAFAFLMVFTFHALTGVRDYYMAEPGAYAYSRIVANLIESCAVGLPLFFFLSAYLIAKLLFLELEKDKTIDVRGFFVRRALRIWPLYFPAVIAGALFAWRHPGLRNDLGFVVPFTFFYADWYTTNHPYIDNPAGPLWSTSVIEQFYLFLPWFFLIPKWTLKHLRTLGFTLIAIAIAVVWSQGNAHVSLIDVLWWNPFSHGIFFGTGLVLASLKDEWIPVLPGWARIAAFLGGFGLLYSAAAVNVLWSGAPVASGLVDLTRFGAQASACVLFVLAVWDLGDYIPKWVSYVGKISFGLIVFHLWSMQLILHFHFLDAIPLPLRRLMALPFDVLFASISYRFYEKPLLKLRSRFTHIQSRPS